jgi:hypothetical protein
LPMTIKGKELSIGFKNESLWNERAFLNLIVHSTAVGLHKQHDQGISLQEFWKRTFPFQTRNTTRDQLPWCSTFQPLIFNIPWNPDSLQHACSKIALSSKVNICRVRVQGYECGLSMKSCLK